MRTFADFWPYYVRHHAKGATRLLHAIGSTLAVVVVAAALAIDARLLLVAPLVGYGLAWYAHAFIERNRPLTLAHPLWSLAADYRMLFLMIAGRMDEEVARHAGEVPGAPPGAASTRV